MTPLQIWICAIRPKTLIAGAAPVLLATAMALSQGFFQLSIFVCTLLTALGIQITTNLANDYFDFLKGADTSERKGPTRIMQAGLASACVMRKAISYAMILTACAGVFLIVKGGLLIAVLLSLSLMLALLYTAGPYPIAYLGLGDLFVFAFFGPIAVGIAYFLQTGYYALSPFLVGCSSGLLSSGILVVNNYRDAAQDALCNKKTLIVRFGDSFGKAEYTLCILAPFLIPFLFLQSHPWTLLSLGCLPMAIRLLPNFYYKQNLNAILAATGKLLFFYSFLFAIGWLTCIYF